MNLEFVGQVGGEITRVLVQDDYVYVGLGPRLVVVAVADPTQPTLLGHTPPLPNRVLDIAVNGSKAYVAYGTGLAVVDISDPARPAVVGEYEEPANPPDVPSVREVAMHVLAGTDVYLLGADNRLRILDVSDPSEPTLLSTLSEPNGAMVLTGTNVYVAGDGTGVHVIDVSQGLAPVEVARFDEGNDAADLAVASGYAYVAEHPVFPQGQHASSVGGGLRIFDVSHPGSPVAMGFFETKERNALELADSTVYLSFDTGPGGRRGTRVMDVSDPLQPTQVETLRLFFRAVAPDRPYGFTADDAGHLRVMDLSDRLHPSLTGDVAVSPSAGGTRLELSRSYAYVANGAALSVVDVSDPADMRLAAAYQARGAIAGLVVDESRQEVFLTWNTSAPQSGVTILDVSDPTAPREVGGTTGPEFLGEMSVANSFAFVVQRGDISVLDLSDAALPRAVSRIIMCTAVSSGCESVADLTTQEGKLYVTYFPNPSGSYGLRVYDVRDPVQPVLMADFRTRGLPDRLRVSKGFAYVSIENFSPGLQIVDISDAGHPAEAGYIPGTSFGAVAPAGSLLYMLASGRLQVFDVGDPAALQPVGVFPGLDGLALGQGLRGDDVATDGATAFVLTEGNGLWAFHFTGGGEGGPDTARDE